MERGLRARINLIDEYCPIKCDIIDFLNKISYNITIKGE